MQALEVLTAETLDLGNPFGGWATQPELEGGAGVLLFLEGGQPRDQIHGFKRACQANPSGSPDGRLSEGRLRQYHRTVMGEYAGLSRREILSSIVELSRGCVLVSLAPTRGIGASEQALGVLRGVLKDGATGATTAAKLRITNLATSEVLWPERAVRTMPKQPRRGGWRYFYARGKYEVALPPGRYQIEAVRGICHQAVVREVEVRAGSAQVADLSIPALKDMRAAGWYSGNTHTHYNVDIEEDPDERLRLVPPAEALDVSVISYLIRNDLPYVTNRYPIGRLPAFSQHGTLVDMGEECRNNKTSGDMGYGHVLFLNIPRLVEPVSTGLLARDPKAPDFPTISMLCQEAKRIGGTTIWCHNGRGMELPVATALGAMDAFNVGDSQEGEYERYYQFLNCGFRLPISTGTDWWIYDHNRVFVRIEGAFRYESWLKGLRAGRTFITNGPLLEFSVNGRGPGADVAAGRPVRVAARALSRLPFDRLEIVRDGEVIAEAAATGGREASLEREVAVERSGWLAARVAARVKTHGGYVVFAHSGPVYLRGNGPLARRQEAAALFVRELEESMSFIRKNYRFASEADLAVAIGRFEQGQSSYRKLAAAPTAGM